MLDNLANDYFNFWKVIWELLIEMKFKLFVIADITVITLTISILRKSTK